MKGKKIIGVLIAIIIFVIFILFFRISFIQADAKEINGTLDKATKNYIVVDGVKYAVTKKTVISDMEHPSVGFPYSPNLLSRSWKVKIIIEKNVVKKILIEVPK